MIVASHTCFAAVEAVEVVAAEIPVTCAFLGRTYLPVLVALGQIVTVEHGGVRLGPRVAQVTAAGRVSCLSGILRTRVVAWRFGAALPCALEGLPLLPRNQAHGFSLRTSGRCGFDNAINVRWKESHK